MIFVLTNIGVFLAVILLLVVLLLVLPLDSYLRMRNSRIGYLVKKMKMEKELVV